MEAVIVIACGLMLGWYFADLNKPKDSKGGIRQLDEKNWIVNGEFVSFDEDRPELIFQQEMEDMRMYGNYERWKLKEDREYIFNTWEKTISRIHQYPELTDVVTPEKLTELEPRYNHYLLMCSKLEEKAFILTK